MEVRPINIAFTALITQFCIIAIVAFGILLLGRTRVFFSDSLLRFWQVTLFVLILTTGTLALQKELLDIVRPMLGGLELSGILTSTALLWMFIVDILYLGWFVCATGGATSSIFVVELSILPALAIFLREGSVRVLSYVVLIAVMLGVALGSPELPDIPEYRSVERRQFKFALWLVAVLCLILTTFIGFVTRPH